MTGEHRRGDRAGWPSPARPPGSPRPRRSTPAEGGAGESTPARPGVESATDRPMGRRTLAARCRTRSRAALDGHQTPQPGARCPAGLMRADRRDERAGLRGVLMRRTSGWQAPPRSGDCRSVRRLIAARCPSPAPSRRAAQPGPPRSAAASAIPEVSPGLGQPLDRRDVLAVIDPHQPDALGGAALDLDLAARIRISLPRSEIRIR